MALVADSNVNTPAIAAAAITALINFNMTAPRSLCAICPQTGDQKSSVTNPQSATPTSSIDHSEGFSANSLPSLTTYANIADTRCWPPLEPHTIGTTGGNGCSAQVTHRLNLAAMCRFGHPATALSALAADQIPISPRTATALTVVIPEPSKADNWTPDEQLRAGRLNCGRRTCQTQKIETHQSL